MKKTIFFLAASLALALFFAGPALAAAAGNSGNLLDPRLVKVLTKFLILSLIFETAMTPIFSWRWYLRHLDGKGWKIPITVIAAFVVFTSFELDILRDVIDIYESKDPKVISPHSAGGQLLTSLLIAGGSDGIFRIFTKLNIRDPKKLKEKAEEEQKKLAERKKKEAEEEQKKLEEKKKKEAEATGASGGVS